MCKSVSIRVAGLLWLAMGCGAFAADAPVPPSATSPAATGLPQSPPPPTAVKSVPITFETTPEIARQLHVGDFVRVRLTAKWPTRTSYTLIERATVISIGAIESDRPVEVELAVPHVVAEKATKYFSQYESDLNSYLQIVPIGPDEQDAVAAAAGLPVSVGTEFVIDSEKKQIQLVVGMQITLQSIARLQAVDGFRDDLVNVKVESPHSIHVTAAHDGKTGSTTLRLTDELGVVRTISIEILSAEQTELSELIGRLYPQSQVEVIQIKTDMLLRGVVPDEATKTEISEIARIYTPNVLNQIKVATTSKTPQIPKGMRVLTITVDPASQVERLRPGERVDILVTFSSRDASGRQVTKTQTLAEYVEIFSTDDQSSREVTPAGRRGTATVGLLLPPEHVPLMKLAESKGKLSLAWRRTGDDLLQSPSPINEALLDALKDLDGAIPKAPLLTSPELPTFPNTKIAPPPTAPVAPPSAVRPNATINQPPAPALQDDIRALHEDVKRLIELLEKRQAAAAHPAKSPDAAAAISLPTEGTHLLSFEAAWCGPCQKMREPLAELEDSQVIDSVIHVNVEQQRQLARQFDVDALPTFVLYKEGKEADRHVGVMSVAMLRGFVGHPVEDSTEPIEELGLSVRELTSDETAKHLRGESYRGGLWIDAVEPGGLAERAGIRPGDILVGLHVWETVSVKNVRYAFDHLRTLDMSPHKFYIRRGGETLDGHFSPPAQDNEPASLEVSPERPELQRPL